ncbi:MULTISPECIES: DUF4333 domain-containing protein [Mycolicibacterium]|uniref:DUF4333 domain-containing protein n=2 Tax=Mycolicibacterium gilvum TaxID=1804 RepID=A0A378SXX0_9MYCO|nr:MULTISPECIES: DUF4333 domain-containing protein [Mycolicibacterium]ABP43531.1 conserved hypothetical protein [Mycolicibacterium gilvum PYR-GCK]MBV5242212.1 DUF4333 domain-containing protein [Mycolicibacterium sp. PAM1]MCV7053984.1 DUF4333 domain-containing protein [Mycolicibacterium gilvum]STZ46247.1 Uncharacterised protein [Mycolicibacterium gilvum]
MVKTLAVSCGAALALSACSFSIGGLDYDKLESGITEQLNNSYSSLGLSVSSVECPETSPGPKKGESLECSAQVGGQTVRVDATVTDDDYNVNFKTIDTLYDLPTVADTLTESVSEQVGFDVTVDCGSGLKAVEVGTTFDCTAADPQGEERTVQVTAAPVGEDDSWELLG